MQGSSPVTSVDKTKLKTYGHTTKNFTKNVSRSIILNGQKVETTQPSICGWMDKQILVYTYNALLFSLKKKNIPTHAIT